MAIPLRLKNYIIENCTYALFEPDSKAISDSYQKGEIAFPYWSQVWPAAIGLAQFIFQHPQYVVGKKVLELAAGSGLPSLVAATIGAAAVVISDYAADAVAAMQQTMAYNQLQNTEVRLLDWRTLPTNLAADVLLLSDVSYGEQLFALQEKIVRRFLQNGTTVIISTPQRLVAKEALLPLLPFCIIQQEVAVEHQQQAVSVSVFVLQL